MAKTGVRKFPIPYIYIRRFHNSIFKSTNREPRSTLTVPSTSWTRISPLLVCVRYRREWCRSRCCRSRRARPHPRAPVPPTPPGPKKATPPPRALPLLPTKPQTKQSSYLHANRNASIARNSTISSPFSHLVALSQPSLPWISAFAVLVAGLSMYSPGLIMYRSPACQLLKIKKISSKPRLPSNTPRYCETLWIFRHFLFRELIRFPPNC